MKTITNKDSEAMDSIMNKKNENNVVSSGKNSENGIAENGKDISAESEYQSWNGLEVDQY